MNNRYTLTAVVVAASVVMVFGILFVYRSVRFLLPIRRPSMPAELKTAQVVTGKGLFSRSLYYKDSDLRVITDIEAIQGGQLVLVGQGGAVFLRPNSQAAGVAHYSRCMSNVSYVNLSTGSFLCRGSWAFDTVLFNREGRPVWTYGVKNQGIDDAAAGELAGTETVVVGLNGSGGVRRLDAKGREIWQQPDGNVWHVEITTPDDGSAPVILHSNAGGQLILRDANGSVVARYRPETYLSNFALTDWDDHPARNDLITAGTDSLYILSMHGQTLAKLSAPSAAGVDAAQGTVVHLQAGTNYAALVRHTIWNRSVLYIYGPQKQLIYQEVLDHDCGALFAQTNSSGKQDLLLGCDGSVWKYSQN